MLRIEEDMDSGLAFQDCVLSIFPEPRSFEAPRLATTTTSSKQFQTSQHGKEQEQGTSERWSYVVEVSWSRELILLIAIVLILLWSTGKMLRKFLSWKHRFHTTMEEETRMKLRRSGIRSQWSGRKRRRRMPLCKGPSSLLPLVTLVDIYWFLSVHGTRSWLAFYRSPLFLFTIPWNLVLFNHQIPVRTIPSPTAHHLRLFARSAHSVASSHSIAPRRSRMDDCGVMWLKRCVV